MFYKGLYICSRNDTKMALLLPPNGTYKVIEDEAKKVQTMLNQWRHQYDIYHLDSQFRDKINGTVLCMLVYLVEKPKTSKPPAGMTANLQPKTAAASEISVSQPNSDAEDDDDPPF